MEIPEDQWADTAVMWCKLYDSLEIFKTKNLDVFTTTFTCFSAFFPLYVHKNGILTSNLGYE